MPGYDPAAHFDARTADLLDRFAQLGVIAARQAVRDSGVSITPARTAVITGCCVGGQGTEDAGFVELYRLKRPRADCLRFHGS